MTELTVLDSGCDDIAGKIASRIDEYGGSRGDILIRSVRSLGDITANPTDILVLSANAFKSCWEDPKGEQLARIRCNILLLPGDINSVEDTNSASADADIFEAGCIVTYGMSPKNTVTFSSLSEDTCILALQRELVTINGDILDRQEMMIKGGLRPDCLLAVAGTLLILGLKISETSR